MAPIFISNGRFAVFALAVISVFGAVSARLFYLHVVDQEQARRVVAESRYRFQEIEPRRGLILDSNGAVLASSRATWDIGVDPQAVDVRDREKLSLLALILNTDQRALERAFGWDDPVASSRNRARWVKLAGEVEESVFKAVSKLDVRGVYGNRYYSRYYPAGTDAAHVVGFVNKARMPVMGIERTLDYYLKGSPGWRVREINGARKEIRQFRVRDVEPQHGFNVQLTIDAGIQRVVESELDRIFHDLEPESATVIVSESSTGAILAMGSRPTFDPNLFWQYDLEIDLRNRAISDIYEPGSTFKIITAAGFLNEGLGDRETVFDCGTRSVQFRNRNVVLPTDTKPRGKIPLHEVIKKSSNRGSALAGLQLGEARFYDYCHAFGIGQTTGIELNGEERGIFHDISKWDHYTLSRLSIGYGVGVTPLQMHTAMSVVANRGKWVAPHVVAQALDSEMRPVMVFQQTEPRQVIRSEVAQEIRDSLVEAVSLGGTGGQASLRNIQVAGKTGTSRKLLSEGYSEDRHVGSFTGFFPASKPEYVITVVVNDPRNTPSTYGGAVAAPAFREIASYIVSSRGLEPATSHPELLVWNP